MNILNKPKIEKTPTSGIIGPGSKFIRKDPNSRNQDYQDVNLTLYENIRALLGLVIYICIFIIIIPVFLFKNKFYNFLKLYFLNTDLIATTISFDKGIFKNIFKYLYNDTGPLVGFISQSIINWSVLMGLFTTVIIDSKKKTLSESLSKIGFILFITYLLPSRFLIKLQAWFYKLIGSKNIYYNIDLNGLLTIIFGLLLVIILIGLEDVIVQTFSQDFKKILEYFYELIKL